MFKKISSVISATLKVMRDKNTDKPVKKRKPSQSEIQKHEAMLAKQKEEADTRKEPWVACVDMDIDYNNLADGSFELDWNDFFIAKLIRAGYVGKEDADLVDQWFTNVCRNVVKETFEQEMADPEKRQQRDLGDGRKEYR